MKKLLFLIILIINFMFLSSLYAFEYWESNFDRNAEVWEVYLSSDTFVKADYNKDGYICYSSMSDINWYLLKLDWYDWSALYGGIISFDIKVSGEGNYKEAGATVILDLPGDIGTFFYANIPLKPDKDVWTTYEVPIRNDLFRKYGDSDALLSDNLLDIRGLDIRGDLLSGIETTCIDNVKIFPLISQPVHWPSSNGGNDHYYDIILNINGVTWEQAKTDAENRGGYLATILTANENQFIFDNLVNNRVYWKRGGQPWENQNFGPWIGWFQPAGSIEPDGGWQWIHGDGVFLFSNWLPNEPNNFNDENAVLFYDNNNDDPPILTDQWNDWPEGNKTISYVVEYDALPFPEIDIKPGEYPNVISHKSKGFIRVAILSSAGYDPSAVIDETSLSFGATGNEPSLSFCRAADYDINMDGVLDLICSFSIEKSGFQWGNTEGILKGTLLNGTAIFRK